MRLERPCVCDARIPELAGASNRNGPDAIQALIERAQKTLRFLHELDLAALDKFRSGWKYSPNSSLKQLENLRSFFNFCVDREWIEKNPAMKMKGPKRTDRPTLPFSPNDMVKILTAFGKYKKSVGISNAQRLRAFF
jgi:site-specific recombinase XerD